MTNAQIILNESFRLMEEGILKGSGHFAEIETDDGPKIVELPEDIHTFNGWKQLGYSVKKGQKAIAKFTIWKHTTKKVENESGEEEDKSRMFMKTAAWFTFAQVEPIKAKA